MATDDHNGDGSSPQAVGAGSRRLRLPEPVRLPVEVLDRHRARVLDPTVAAVQPGARRPESTAYRADTLLIPLRFAVGPENRIERYNAVLRPLGVRLRSVIPETPAWREARRTLHPELPVPVLLEPREDVVSDRAPDPWAALVALRRAPGNPDLSRGVGLDHVFMAASTVMEGVPVSEPQSPGAGGETFTGGITLHAGNRDPVRVFAPAPIRRPAGTLAAGRRPVVAVVDTGIGTHDWLPIGDIPADPVVEVSQSFQGLLADHERAIAKAVSAPTIVLDSPMEEADLVQQLLGLIDSHAGHGTFVTGLVHQNCPDTRVLSLRVIHTDGITTEGSVLLALDWLRARVAAALARGAAAELIDVVSLSLGFYPETAEPESIANLAAVIDRLTELGVLVVAAAGNHASARPFLPAALGPDVLGDSSDLLVAVGALNAFGSTIAAFSNEGPWVRRWAPGNAMVSTVPTEFQGAASPSLEAGNGSKRRANTDPDDLRTGFAVWAGTSFATPVISGLLATTLADLADAKEPEQRCERARQALKATDTLLHDRGWM